MVRAFARKEILAQNIKIRAMCQGMTSWDWGLEIEVGGWDNVAIGYYFRFEPEQNKHE